MRPSTVCLQTQPSHTQAPTHASPPLSDWVVDKGSIFNTNQTGGELAMILTEDNGGTRISSTRYMHYGTVTANCK